MFKVHDDDFYSFSLNLSEMQGFADATQKVNIYIIPIVWSSFDNEKLN
jgi:hypothetical protein